MKSDSAAPGRAGPRPLRPSESWAKAESGSQGSGCKRDDFISQARHRGRPAQGPVPSLSAGTVTVHHDLRLARSRRRLPRPRKPRLPHPSPTWTRKLRCGAPSQSAEPTLAAHRRRRPGHGRARGPTDSDTGPDYVQVYSFRSRKLPAKSRQKHTPLDRVIISGITLPHSRRSHQRD